MFYGFFELEGNLSGSLLVTSSGTPINADAYPTYRIYGPDGYVEAGTCALMDSGDLTNATNATPIVVTSTAHGLTTGTRVTISGVEGNTAANGTFIVTRVDANTFSLDDSVGNGGYTTGGAWNVTGLYSYTTLLAGTSGYEAGECYAVLLVYQVSSTNYGQLHSFNVN